MFRPIILVFLVSLIPFSSSDQIVGQIRECPKGVGDQALNECLHQVVLDILRKAKTGIPKLGLEPLEPLILEKFSYNWGFDRELRTIVTGKNLKIHKLTNTDKIHFNADIKKRTVNFTLEFPVVNFETEYKLNGNIFFFPLIGGGPAEVAVEKLKISGHMHFSKVENENGENVIQVDGTSIESATIKDLRVRIRGLFEGIPTLSAMIHMIANRYGPLIFDFIRPTFDGYLEDILQNRLFNPVLEKLPFIADFAPNL